MTPTVVRRVWEIVILHPDGRREKISEVVWPGPQPADSFPREGTAFRSRYRQWETSFGSMLLLRSAARWRNRSTAISRKAPFAASQ